ncbi:hypothetical protein MNBD_GAMMA11-2369 [hydrothermal vent metagenome]|uniref:Uncharacterized protein n=1 Tax=hydrothermal vent metagenome TaxID=652676 RepID=A0A3B0WW61_9ZZZZ
MKKKIINNIALASMLVTATAAYAANTGLYNPNSSNLTIENTISEVDGAIGGFLDSNGNVNGDASNPDNVSILYPISGTVYATVTDGTTGETLGSFKEAGVISATALFDVSFFGLTGDWSLLPETMPWTMMDDFRLQVNGSTFRFEEKLTGRAFPQLGPVEDPALTGTLALRMAGCAGVREISGSGAYANKVGTLCLNGTFTFDADFNGKGVSNCTIAVHDPVQ